MPFPHTKRPPLEGAQPAVQLGLRANWQQFTLLVIVNAFVGGMVGLERSIVPLLGHQVFGLASTTETEKNSDPASDTAKQASPAELKACVSS